MTLKEWLDLTSVAAATIAALAGTGAAIFVSLQVAHMRRSREVDTFLRIIDAGNTGLVRRAGNWVKHDMAPDLPYEQAIANENRDKIATVVHHFEMIGTLVEHGYISRKLVYDQMGPWVVGSWGKLELIISAHRTAKRAPDYAENFELLANGYSKWAAKNPAKLEKRSRATPAALESYYKQKPNDHTKA